MHECLGWATPGGNFVDLNAAYALLLAERDDHPRCYELADLLVPADMIEFLRGQSFAVEAVGEIVGELGEVLEDTSVGGADGEPVVYAPEDIFLLAPLPRPNSLRCCVSSLDQMRATLSDKANVPEYWHQKPVYYKGNPDAVVGTGAEIVWPNYTDMLDYELQFACVIGVECLDVPVTEAWDCIAGYTIFNDVTARDVLAQELQCMLGPGKGKDMDGGNVLGPYLVTADEWDPRDGHAMIARVNGEERGRGSTRDMHHDFATIIHHLSLSQTLHVGDVITSGSVAGGCGWEVGKLPSQGDRIDLEVEGLGVLSNRFVKG